MLRLVYAMDGEELKARGRRARERVCANFTWPRAYLAVQQRLKALMSS
jgi:hypothetical protein